MIIQSRRNFITGLTSLLAAPAIVRVGSLMPVRSVYPNLIDIRPMVRNYYAGLELKIGDIVTFSNSKESWKIIA